jgi:hypothetical protein
VGIHQLGAQVLIAAILQPVIRADGMTPAGACREWPKPKIPDDRRGGERVWRAAKGTNRSAQFRLPTRVAAADAVRPPIERRSRPVRLRCLGAAADAVRSTREVAASRQ